MYHLVYIKENLAYLLNKYSQNNKAREERRVIGLVTTQKLIACRICFFFYSMSIRKI